MYQHCTAQTQSQNIVNILNVHAFLNSYDQQLVLKNSLIIQEQNTKKNHKRVVVLYVMKNHVNLHKL